MRTTLDIDDDVLATAKDLAKAEKRTAGKVISELARKGLIHRIEPLDVSKLEVRDGFPVLPARGGVVTKELIDDLEDEEYREHARAARR